MVEVTTPPATVLTDSLIDVAAHAAEVYAEAAVITFAFLLAHAVLVVSLVLFPPASVLRAVGVEPKPPANRLPGDVPQDDEQDSEEYDGACPNAYE